MSLTVSFWRWIQTNWRVAVGAETERDSGGRFHWSHGTNVAPTGS